MEAFFIHSDINLLREPMSPRFLPLCTSRPNTRQRLFSIAAYNVRGIYDLIIKENRMKHPLLFAALLSLSCASQAAGFKLTSTDIAEGKPMTSKQVFKGFGCDGGNVSPQLSWSGAPAGTKSFAVTAYDPDAPTGSGWWHWTVVNLPASTTSLPTGAGSAGGALPAGAVQGRTDFGQAGFGGACPPEGDKPHHYQFTVWALKVDKLPIDENAAGAMVGFMVNANALGKARLTATYGR
jgi:Raf kinase inhibitor-like YbhB/YbcL family protein